MESIPEAQELATNIVRKLKDHGYTAYFAGGWVRDYLLEHPSEDVDIVTDAEPDAILDLFPRTLVVGLAFGVVVVLVDGHQFEVSTFRTDVDYVGGRRPTRIEHSTPQEDAKRRDFTINGMFYDPIEDVIYDYVGGLEDLQKQLIRTIGDPFERFSEDRLRMIRCIRFAARFGFHVDKETQEAIAENAVTLLPAVAMERVWQEIKKMAKGPRLDFALIEMHRLGLLQVIFPILKDAHLNDIKQHVATFDDFPEETPVIGHVLELFPDATLEQWIEVCKSLKIPNREIRFAEFLHHSQKLLMDQHLGRSSVSLFHWAHFYAHDASLTCTGMIGARLPPSERIEFFLYHDTMREKLAPHIDRIRRQRPLVNAALLQKQGIAPGKKMGELLKEAERLTINEDLQNPQEVVQRLKEGSLWPSAGETI